MAARGHVEPQTLRNEALRNDRPRLMERKHEGPSCVGSPLRRSGQRNWREHQVRGEASVSGVTATFGFVDLAGFTALTEAHGDAEAVVMLDRFESTARYSLCDGGRLVKTIGDAIMLAFDEPAAAVTSVVALFGALQSTDLPVARCGLHHGAAVERNGDYFGASVNLAARIAGQAHGGQVLVTLAVAGEAQAAGLSVVELGCFDLRNIAEPVELFELRVASDDGPTLVDPVCRMQVERDSAAGRLRHLDRDYWFCSLQCASIFTADPDRVVASTR